MIIAKSDSGSEAHTNLTDMPSAANTDHDGRYFTESELGGTAVDLSAHTHVGGAGGQVSHLNLSNIGTKAHTVLDNHVDNVSEDHTQYLLLDGTRAMSGDLDMSENDILNANEIVGGTLITDTLVLKAHSAAMVDPDVDARIEAHHPLKIVIPDMSSGNTNDAYIQSIVLDQTIDVSGQSIIAPIMVYNRSVIEFDTVQNLGTSATFWDETEWKETSAIVGSHIIFSTTGFNCNFRYATDHAGAGNPPIIHAGYNSEPRARTYSTGTLTMPKVSAYTTNRPLIYRSYLALSQFQGNVTIDEYCHYEAFSDVADCLIVIAGAVLTTEYGLKLNNLNKATTNISIFSDADGAYMDHAGDIRINSDTRGLVLGAGQDAKLHYDGTDVLLDTSVTGSGTLQFNSANNWTANGTGTVTISNVAPAGVGTATINKWLTIKDNAGTVYYVPAWT